MTDQSSDVFSNKAPQETPAQQSPSTDPFVDRLKEIRNESGEQKYDSPEKALEALKHSQAYIPELKGQLKQQAEELEALKQELAKRASVEEVVSRLKPAQPSEQQLPDADQQRVSGLDEEAAKKLFESMLEQNNQKSKLQVNRQEVNSALSKAYGDKVSDVVAEKAQQLGTTVEQLGELASQNPKLVLSLFQTGTTSGPSPTTSSNTLPYGQSRESALEKPSKSLLAGATSKDQTEYMAKIKERIYKKYGVQT